MPKSVDGSGVSGAQVGLEFGKDHFDRIKIGTVGWQEQELGSYRADRLSHGLTLVAAEVDNNLRDYRDTIGHLFPANGFVILSNGLEAVMGAAHAPYKVFAPWKRLEEDGPDDPSLETLLRATCEPARFLDLIESFMLFDEARGGLRKIVGKYHQVLGFNRAIEAVRHIESNQGRLTASPTIGNRSKIKVPFHRNAGKY